MLPCWPRWITRGGSAGSKRCERPSRHPSSLHRAGRNPWSLHSSIPRTLVTRRSTDRSAPRRGVTGVAAELEDFSLAAATQGSDALGEAVVTLSQGSHVVVGRAMALDVIEAAANAYVNALNWLVRPQQEVGARSATA